MEELAISSTLYAEGQLRIFTYLLTMLGSFRFDIDK